MGDHSSQAPVLIVSADLEAQEFLDRVLARCNFVVRQVSRLGGMAEQLRKEPVALVVTERDLPDGTWRDVLAVLESLSPSPLLIVTSRAADARLWADVLSVGGFDVLAKPLDQEETTRVVLSALRRYHAACAAC